MTTPKSGYCVDADAWIDLRVYYSPATHPTLWDELLPHLISEGLLVTPRQVLDELEKEIELHSWMQGQSGLVVQPSRAELRTAFAIVKVHAKLLATKSKQPRAVDVADPYLIAVAEVRKLTVVTQEMLPGGNDQQVKIPTVCRERNVRCLHRPGIAKFVADAGFVFK